MESSNVLIVVIVAFVGIAVVLLVRFLRRRQHAAVGRSSSVPAAASLRGPVDPPESRRPADPRPMPSVASRASREISWADSRLFSRKLGADPEDSPLPRIASEDLPNADASDYVLGPLTPILFELLPESAERREEIKRELRNAGYYQPHALQNLSAVRYLAIVVPMIFFGMLLVLVPQPLELPVVVLLVLGPMLGWAFPRLYVKNKGTIRKHEIERAMPDLLDTLNMCVSQGLTVQHALKRITPDFAPVYPDLAKELNILNEQSAVGSLQVALENFSRRVDVPEVHSFTSLIIQTERMGTSVSDALTEYSDTMRESLRQRADAKANQASFKLLFPTVLCLMPAVYVFLLSPAIVEVARFFADGGGSTAINRGQQAIEELNR